MSGTRFTDSQVHASQKKTTGRHSREEVAVTVVVRQPSHLPAAQRPVVQQHHRELRRQYGIRSVPLTYDTRACQSGTHTHRVICAWPNTDGQMEALGRCVIGPRLRRATPVYTADYHITYMSCILQIYRVNPSSAHP
jgi:hypothetical protein